MGGGSDLPSLNRKTCHIQGTVTASEGGGDLELDTDSLVAGQTVTITKFELTDGNA